MIAEQYLDQARHETDEQLGLTIDIGLEDEIWAYRIHVYEKGVDPNDRRHWKYEGTKMELEAGALQ